MTVDRLFLDANILFSVAYGSPGLTRLWKFAEKNDCMLLASNYVVEEARRNLSHAEQSEELDRLLLEVKIVPDIDPQLPCPVDLPEKDRPVLLAAISTRADYLLTGDTIHFGKYFGKTIRGVRICRPRDYFSRLTTSMRRKMRRR